MRQKKKGRKKKKSLPSLSKEQETLVLSLLNRVAETDPKEIVAGIPDPLSAEFFVDRLPMEDETAVSLLQAIDASFTDRHVKKAVKKALFRLKSKGISTEGFSTDSTSEIIFKPKQTEAPRCHVGPIDTLGSRAVIIHFHESPKGVDVGMGMVSDEAGIQEFVFDQMARKQARGLKTELARMAGPLVEVPLSHGAMILEDAFQIEDPLKAESRADYLRLRPWLLENTSMEAYTADFGTLDTERKGTDADLQRLFDHRLMKSWVAPFEFLKPFMEEIYGIYESPIILSESQKLDRVREIREKCVNALFEGSKKKRFKKRLFEMAFFFLKSDQKEYAQLSYDAALTIDEGESRFTQQPVLDFFVERSIQFYGAMGNETAGENPEEAGPSTSSETPSGILLP
jgi:hypothetical protein